MEYTLLFFIISLSYYPTLSQGISIDIDKDNHENVLERHNKNLFGNVTTLILPNVTPITEVRCRDMIFWKSSDENKGCISLTIVKRKGKKVLACIRLSSTDEGNKCFEGVLGLWRCLDCSDYNIRKSQIENETKLDLSGRGEEFEKNILKNAITRYKHQSFEFEPRPEAHATCVSYGSRIFWETDLDNEKCIKALVHVSDGLPGFVEITILSSGVEFTKYYHMDQHRNIFELTENDYKTHVDLLEASISTPGTSKSK